MNFELSKVQRHFFTLDRLFPDSRAYNIPLLYRISGPANIKGLHHALQKVSQEYTLIRSSIQCNDSNRYFFSISDILTPFEEIHSRPEEIDTVIDSLINQRLEIEDSLFKAYILLPGNGCSYVLFLFHHVIIDLHSKSLFIRCFEDAYNNCAGNNASFNDGTEDFAKSINYSFWHNQLASEALSLPSSSFGRTRFEGRGSFIEWNCDPDIAGELSEMEKSGRYSPFLYFLTAYCILLFRISRQYRFNIGIPFTNRKEEVQKNAQGAFVNILPLSVSISENETFEQLYAKIRKQMLFLHRQQDIPFTDIAKMYGGERNPHYPYILQAGFTTEPLTRLNLKGLDVECVPVHPQGAQMDLFFTYWPKGEGFCGRWEFNTNAFTRSQIYEWMHLYDVLLDELKMGNKDFRRIQFVKRNEIDTLTGYFRTATDRFPVRRHIAAILLDSYRKHSEHTALVTDDKEISYEQLSSAVVSLAVHLRESYGTGKHIAVSMHKSIDLVIALHAIVVSGNIFVPLDPEWPDRRKEFITEDANTTAILDEGYTAAFIDQKSSITVDHIRKIELLVSELPEDGGVYILYTSGSTGSPKGVLIPSNGLVNRLYWMQDTFSLDSNDCIFQKTPVTFDVSMWELFWPLLFGARMFIPNPYRWFDNRYIYKSIMIHAVSYIHFVPSMLRDFLAEGKKGEMPSLNAVICSGEVLEPKLLGQFYSLYQHIPLYNLYGPTEASIDVTYWKCSPADTERKSVPIGVPISNTGIFILNEHDQICPPYIEGEICISGIGLAKEYWNRPKLTTTKFDTVQIEDYSIRIYRTGDRGRYLNDGIVEYIGRNDSQIKINGVRIELGEIEHIIDSIPGIRKSVVLSEKLNGYTVLSAYAEVEDQTISISNIKMKAADKLPGYMIPQKFHMLKKIPLLANGKIDRKTLSEMRVMEFSANQDYSNDELERIWEELLQLSDIPHDKNFFDLGGHSMLLIEMHTQIQRRLNIKIDLPLLFKYTTLNSLSEYIRSGEQSRMAQGITESSKSIQRISRLRPRGR